MVAEKETFQESFHGVRDTKVVIKSKAPLQSPSFGKQGCPGLAITIPCLPQVIFIFTSLSGAVRYKKQVRLIETASATERFHSFKPKILKRDKNCLRRIFSSGQPCHLQRTGLSLWLPSALRKLLNSFPVCCVSQYYSCHLDLCVSTERVDKEAHTFEGTEARSREKSKQRANLGSRSPLLRHPWNYCLNGRNAQYILSLTEKFSLTSLWLPLTTWHTFF